jgi:quercetin dioxygenase-like cupin family protein
MSEPIPPPDAAEPADPGDATDQEPTASVVPVDLRDWVDLSPDRATRVRALATARSALDLWCLEPGQSTPVLRLPEQDVTYVVIGGRSWFVTDEGEVGLDPMGAMLVPAGVVHGIDNRGADPLIVLATVTPPGAAAPDAPVSRAGAAIRQQERKPNRLARAWRGLLGVDGGSGR